MYADEVTKSMENAIMETNRRRSIQDAYNKEHGIIPKTIVKEIRDIIEITPKKRGDNNDKNKKLTTAEKATLIKQYTALMKEAAKLLDFEQAAIFRDRIAELSK